MKYCRMLALLLIAALAAGMLPAVRADAEPEPEPEQVVSYMTEYGEFVEDDTAYHDSLLERPATRATDTAAQVWAMENSVWLQALEYTGYPVQRLLNAGLLFNANKTGWYSNYMYQEWIGYGLNETTWKYTSHYPTNYAQAVSAWAKQNVSGSYVFMASVGSAGGMDGRYYKGYSPSTVTYGSKAPGAGVAYKSGSYAVAEKPADWKKAQQTTDQGHTVQRGLVCVSVPNYVYFNFLPEVLGWTKLDVGNYWHTKSVSGTPYTLGGLALPKGSWGSGQVITYNNCDSLFAALSHSTWSPYTKITSVSTKAGISSALSAAKPGAILLFKHGTINYDGSFKIEESMIAHAAIYVGTINGRYWILHINCHRGPELQTMDPLIPESSKTLLVKVVEPPPFLRIKLDGPASVFQNATFTVTYTNPGSSAKSMTVKAVQKTDRRGKVYGEYILPMGTIQENASVKITMKTADGAACVGSDTVSFSKAAYGENLACFQIRETEKVSVTALMNARTGGTTLSAWPGSALSVRLSADKLVSGHDYKLRAQVVDAATGTILTDAAGSQATRESKSFTANAATASRTLLFELDTSKYSGRTLAVKSWLLDLTTGKTAASQTNVNLSACRIKVGGIVDSEPYFRDVVPGSYYETAVNWAAENGIANGTAPYIFSPDGECTRAQVVTFLWRAAGCPEPAETEIRFSDVQQNAYYAKAVRWAVENQITNGTGGGKFSPDKVCTRAEVVTFLYRSEGSPRATGASPFRDVNESDYFYTAVIWAVKNGITKGVSKTAFAPEAICSRAQVVTFLYRTAHYTPVPEPDPEPDPDPEPEPDPEPSDPTDPIDPADPTEP